MVAGEVGIVRAGAQLLWRRQRLVWCVYAVNFLLALLGTVPVALRLGSVLDHSLAADRLSGGFDVGLLLELLSQPEIALRAQVPGALFLSLLFFVFMLFLTGGILEVYREDRTLSMGEFFEAGGAFFWRFVRLLVFLALALVPVGLIFSLVQRGSSRLASDAPQEMLGFYVQLAGTAMVLFLLMVVRLWFDMAQVYTVAESERAMRRALARAFKLTFRNFPKLFWMYLRISLVAWAGLALAAWVWFEWVRPERVEFSFLLGQAVLLLWLATRLWQRASETCWYQCYHDTPVPTGPEEPQPELEELLSLP